MNRGRDAPAAIDTRSYDESVFDASGWIYLLPPLRGSRLICIDAVGNVAHRLAAEGAEVTVVVPDGQAPWAAEYLDSTLRPTFDSLRFAGPDAIAGAWNDPTPRASDGVVVHDLHGTSVRAADVPAMIRLLRGLVRHLDARAFVYVGALRRWSPWNLRGRSGGTEASARQRGVSRRGHFDLVRAAGAVRADEHPYLLSGPGLTEIIGTRGYRSSKNRELRAERAKEFLLRPGLARHLTPGAGLVGHLGKPRESVIDLSRTRIAYADKDPGACRPVITQCLVLHAGKVILGLKPPAPSDAAMTVVLARGGVAVRRREVEAASLSALAGLPDRLAGLLPRYLGRVEVEGVQAFIQSTRPGVTCDLDLPGLAGLTRRAADFLVDLHEQTRQASTPSHAAALICSLCTAAMLRAPQVADSLLALRTAVEICAGELDFPLVCMHGDFKIENVMYDQRSGALTGVIDWELSMPKGLPLLDLLYLLAFNRMIRRQSRTAALGALTVGDALEQEERDLSSIYLRRLGIPECQRLPLAVAFLCHDIGCRIQFDDLPPAAIQSATEFIDGLRERLLDWHPARRADSPAGLQAMPTTSI